MVLPFFMGVNALGLLPAYSGFLQRRALETASANMDFTGISHSFQNGKVTAAS